MKKGTPLLASLLFICLASTPIFAQITSQKNDLLMEDALAKFKVAGASIAVAKDGKVIHQKGYSVASVETKKAVNENTNFQIASIVKFLQLLHFLF
ncbi:beta-lactamase family protein [Flavobacterium sp. JAS]|nr:serine hydrolase domain-containing protein [Flavobacterium sp. JAS]MCD0469770.1 beta-lactamase family protein [Flavobacterium sp. JAS]